MNKVALRLSNLDHGIRQAVIEHAKFLSALGVGDLKDTTIAQLAEAIKEKPPPEVTLWDRDIESELYIHPAPTAPRAWERRTLAEIVGVCFHHTGHNQSPHYVAQSYCTSKGRPTMPYTLWITPDGQALKCVDLELAIWHNHEGSRKNLWLSVGLAGPLHLYHPPNVQLKRAARLAKDVIESDDFPGVDSVTKVRGHDDFIETACPGWNDEGEAAPSGRWRPYFYDMLTSLLQ